MSAHANQLPPALFSIARGKAMPLAPDHGIAQRRIGEFTRLLRARLLPVLVLGLAIGSGEILNVYDLMFGADKDFGWTLAVLVNRPIALLPILAVITAAQVWLAEPRLRQPVMAFGVLAIALLLSVLQGSDWWRQLMGMSSMTVFQRAPTLYLLWVNVAFGTMLAILYEWQARDDQVMQAVRTTELADEAVERQTLESRLSGMKARVDPELLFAVIARAQELYSHDIDAAERLLEQLIDFLRATLPRNAGASATLEQEIRLCTAFLAIEKTLRLSELSYQLKSDGDTANCYFPPAVLLPLLQALLTPRAQTQPAAHVLIEIRRQVCGIRIDMTCRARSVSLPRATIEAAATLLRTLFGSQATVLSRPVPSAGQSICIEVPYVSA